MHQNWSSSLQLALQQRRHMCLCTWRCCRFDGLDRLCRSPAPHVALASMLHLGLSRHKQSVALAWPQFSSSCDWCRKNLLPLLLFATATPSQTHIIRSWRHTLPLKAQHP
jgi:hypothetical protein